MIFFFTSALTVIWWEPGVGGGGHGGDLSVWISRLADRWPMAISWDREEEWPPAQTWHTNRFPVSVIQCMYFVFIYEQLELVQGQ